ncbi:uncharacterized protein [Dysidea avara]|uniref:uncharacterized protein n=1 Tax=Dysidea avara TaxID=196820 RepID=UPI00332D4FEA
MAAHGTVSQFSSAQETWTSYIERLEQYLVANKDEDADQCKAILLSVCGPATYRLIHNLASPKKPTELKFQDIVDLVTKQHDSKPSVSVQRYRFNTRNRHAGESILTYVAELRHLSEHCNFGTSLNEMQRDRIVCGIEDPKIQRRLLAEPELTFDKAFGLSLASESADKNAKDLQPVTKVPQDVHKLHTKQQPPCYHCGGKHKSRDCRHKVAECHNCGKVGHLARVCKSKPTTGKVRHPPQRSTTTRPTNMLLEDTNDYSMYNLTGPPVKPLVVSVKLNNVDLKMQLDTGTSISIISEATYNRLWPQGKTPAIQESHVKLKTYSGERLTVKEVIKVEVQYRTITVSCGLGKWTKFVWKGLADQTLLCLDWTQLCANHVCYSLSLHGILD